MNTYINIFKESPIIAVIRNMDEKNVYNIIEALLKGGIRNIELTYGASSPAPLIKKVKREFKRDIVIGAGTVLTVEQAKESIDYGAEFIFSPIYDKNVVIETVRQNVISIPGCYSPTEMYEAYQSGAKIVKLFPATSLGPDFIKDIKAPMPFLNIIPTGGINKENISNYIKAGAIAVGMGGALLDKDLIADKNFKKLADNSRELVNIALGK